jgi:hypothetical protein
MEHGVTASTEWYEVMLDNFLANEMHHCDLPIWFQWYGVTTNTAWISMAVLCQTFPK